MGRKDASAPMAPVDQYRKQIGKLENKKAKQEFRQHKRREGVKTKKSKAISFGFMMLFAFLLLLVVVYLVLYLYLQYESEQVKWFVEYTEQMFNKYVKPYLPFQ